MEKKPTYPLGAKIRIKDPEKKPPNWNIEMMRLVGEIAYVKSNGGGGLYRYKLAGWNWSWRHCDLELLEMPRLNPNEAFKHRFL